MPEAKTERLLNLVICLLHTRRYLSVQQIRDAVPGYAADSEEAFRRMFERDKEELRELGVPLETGTDSHAHDDEPGYRIARRDYELPAVSLEPDEAAAVGLAARLWQSAPQAAAARSALLKLQAAGVELERAPGALQPRSAASEPAFDACWAAVREGQVLRFDYRRPGGHAAEEREVEPWGVVSWRSRWYLVGHDRGRAAERVFRLSRIHGAVRREGRVGSVVVPSDLDLRSMVARLTADEPTVTAVVRLRAGTGWELRRAAASTRPADEPGWDVVEVGFSDPERFADRVTGFGADAVVESPPEARDAVVRRLRSLAGVTGAPSPGTDAAAVAAAQGSGA